MLQRSFEIAAHLPLFLFSHAVCGRAVAAAGCKHIAHASCTRAQSPIKNFLFDGVHWQGMLEAAVGLELVIVRIKCLFATCLFDEVARGVRDKRVERCPQHSSVNSLPVQTEIIDNLTRLDYDARQTCTVVAARPTAVKLLFEGIADERQLRLRYSHVTFAI